MAHRDEDVKHVIILDEERRKDDVAKNEAEELLREIDEYIGEEDNGPVKRNAGKKSKTGRGRRPLVSSHLKRHIITLSFSLIILAGVICAAILNSDIGYREPVKIYERYLNTPEYDGEELSFAYGNGLAGRKFKKLREIQHGFDDYNEMLNASRKVHRMEYEETCARYGENRRYSIRIDDAVKLSDGELGMLTADFNGIISDLSKSSYARASDAALESALKDLTDELGGAKISGGYRLYCTQSIQGSGEDGPVSETGKCEFTVVKINGHWLLWDRIYDIFRMNYL